MNLQHGVAAKYWFWTCAYLSIVGVPVTRAGMIDILGVTYQLYRCGGIRRRSHR